MVLVLCACDSLFHTTHSLAPSVSVISESDAAALISPLLKDKGGPGHHA